MARFTSIGMPRKTFVASAAEDSTPAEVIEAGPSSPVKAEEGRKKRKRSKGGKGDGDGSAPLRDAGGGPHNSDEAVQGGSTKSWGRDENIASKLAKQGIQLQTIKV